MTDTEVVLCLLIVVLLSCGYFLHRDLRSLERLLEERVGQGRELAAAVRAETRRRRDAARRGSSRTKAGAR